MRNTARFTTREALLVSDLLTIHLCHNRIHLWCSSASFTTSESSPCSAIHLTRRFSAARGSSVIWCISRSDLSPPPSPLLHFPIIIQTSASVQWLPKRLPYLHLFLLTGCRAWGCTMLKEQKIMYSNGYVREWTSGNYSINYWTSRWKSNIFSPRTKSITYIIKISGLVQGKFKRQVRSQSHCSKTLMFLIFNINI